MKATWSQFQTSYGAGAVICKDDRIAYVFLPHPKKAIAKRVAAHSPGAEERKSGKSPAVRAAAHLGKVLAGKADAGELLGDIEWPKGTAFQLAVLRACSKIPRGKVLSYGELARKAGYPGCARAAGTVMATNPLSLVIPCHRVVRSDGSVGQYGGGPEMKRRLLEQEGARGPSRA